MKGIVYALCLAVVSVGAQYGMKDAVAENGSGIQKTIAAHHAALAEI